MSSRTGIGNYSPIVIVDDSCSAVPQTGYGESSRVMVVLSNNASGTAPLRNAPKSRAQASGTIFLFLCIISTGRREYRFRRIQGALLNVCARHIAMLSARPHTAATPGRPDCDPVRGETAIEPRLNITILILCARLQRTQQTKPASDILRHH